MGHISPNFHALRARNWHHVDIQHQWIDSFIHRKSSSLASLGNCGARRDGPALFVGTAMGPSKESLRHGLCLSGFSRSLHSGMRGGRYILELGRWSQSSMSNMLWRLLLAGFASAALSLVESLLSLRPLVSSGAVDKNRDRLFSSIFAALYMGSVILLHGSARTSAPIRSALTRDCFHRPNIG